MKPFNQCEDILESLPDGVIICDREGKILHINAAALKLFELPSARPYQGTSYQQFLQRFAVEGHEQMEESQPEQWLLCLVASGEARDSSLKDMLVLQTSSGSKLYLNVCDSPLLDTQKRSIGTVSVFYNVTYLYEKALHMQQVHRALLNLTKAIEHIPTLGDLAFSQRAPLLSPPVLFIAKQLVDLVRRILDCNRVGLMAFGPPEGHLYYVVGSGMTDEQERDRRETRGRFALSDALDEQAVADLSANRAVLRSTKQMHLLPELKTHLQDENLLLVPLFLEQRLAGLLIIIKTGAESEYTPQEISLTRAVADQTVLVIDCLCCLYTQAEAQTRARVQREMDHLTSEFLALAGHELRTPLTGTIGNIQLAQRRLANLKRQVAEQNEQISQNIAQVEYPLVCAAQSAHLQERMISDLIDDARIQTNHLELDLRRRDLLALVGMAIANQQRSTPERTIVLKTLPGEQPVPVIVDAFRITQVINNYLTNALRYSPSDRPVTVQVEMEGASARVSVHDEGPGIPIEEQKRLWERFYRAKGSSIQHDLDLGLGLSLYLCQVLIERHHGSVGVQSYPGHTTFWFTLPLSSSSSLL